MGLVSSVCIKEDDGVEVIYTKLTDIESHIIFWFTAHLLACIFMFFQTLLPGFCTQKDLPFTHALVLFAPFVVQATALTVTRIPYNGKINEAEARFLPLIDILCIAVVCGGMWIGFFVLEHMNGVSEYYTKQWLSSVATICTTVFIVACEVILAGNTFRLWYALYAVKQLGRTYKLVLGQEEQEDTKKND